MITRKLIYEDDRLQVFDVFSDGKRIGTDEVSKLPSEPTVTERLNAIEPLVLPPTDPAERQRYEQLQNGYRLAMTDLRAIAKSTGNLSASQLSNAVRVIANSQISMLRLLARQFDGVD